MLPTFDLRSLFHLKGSPALVVQRDHGEAGETRFEFDDSGPAQRLTMAHVNDGARRQIASYAFDPERNAYEVTLDGAVVRVELDELGRNRRMQLSRGGRLVSFATYEHFGRTCTVRGYWVRRGAAPRLVSMKVQTLDADERVTREWVAGPRGGTRQYAYDKDGNLSLRTTFTSTGETTRTQYQYVFGYAGNWVSRRTLTWDKQRRRFELTAWTSRAFEVDAPRSVAVVGAPGR